MKINFRGMNAIPMAEMELWQEEKSGQWTRNKSDKSNMGKGMRTKLLDPTTESISYKECPVCKGEGVYKDGCKQTTNIICELCQGNTALGVDPLETNAYPGSPEKIAVIAARYAQGLPLHIEHDIKVGAVELPELMQLI